MEGTYAGEFLDLREMRLEDLRVLVLEAAVELCSNVSKRELPRAEME